MTFCNVFKILVVLSLTATGTAMARDHSGVTAGAKGKTAHIVKADKVVKADKAGAKNGQVPVKNGLVPVSVRHAVVPQAPIVMGRSVSVHHKTKIHHVKMQSLESLDSAVAADDPK
jgi:hypothetical protein